MVKFKSNAPRIRLFQRHFKRKRISVEGYFGQVAVADESDDLGRIFFGFVAPSFESKMQSAFVFRSIKPLYFLITRYPLD